jgi:hypothetical protein
VVAVLVLAERPVWPQRSYNAVPAAAGHPPPGRCWFRLGHEPKTARLFEQVALVMEKIGLINGEANGKTMPAEDASAFDVQCSRRQLKRADRSRVDDLVARARR